LNLLRISAENSDSVVGLVTSLTDPTPSKVEIPFKLGSKAKVLDVEYEVGPTQPYKVPPRVSNPGGYPGGYPGRWLSSAGKYWTSLFNVNGATNGGYSLGTFAVYGIDKDPILYVDRNGNPVSAVTYLSDPEPDNSGYEYDGLSTRPAKESKPHKYVKALFYQLQSIPGASSYVTNVNPAKIGTIQINYSVIKGILFDNIPLDPKS
jgi:hypothetical protein